MYSHRALHDGVTTCRLGKRRWKRSRAIHPEIVKHSRDWSLYQTLLFVRHGPVVVCGFVPQPSSVVIL